LKAILLAAGLGTRLRPLTDKVPKCLVPIRGKPLLGYWLDVLNQCDVEEILINTHYHADQVEKFVISYASTGIVKTVYEPYLLGTAGTIRKNSKFFRRSEPSLVIHADNFCLSDLSIFRKAHQRRPDHTKITMLTFRTESPEQCGIVDLDAANVVTGFYEKIKNPPGNIANGAVYIFEPEVIDTICNYPGSIDDLSTDLLPLYLGRIFSWEANGPHIDIGTPANYDAARTMCSQLAFE
jgi:mannose-1-phosphate guanylyltransferase